MPKLKFQEPTEFDYLYVDEKNRVHLLFPIVGGDEIAVDNTCKTALELQKFFFGKPDSAKDKIDKYIELLRSDIQAIKDQTELPAVAYAEILKAKEARLLQIVEYSKMVNELVLDDEIQRNMSGSFPTIPEGVHELLKTSKNAFAIRLSPEVEDSVTRFKSPVFSITRQNVYRGQSSSGLGYELRKAFTPTLTNKPEVYGKTPRETVIEASTAKLADLDKPTDPEKFTVWLKAVEKEAKKYFPEADFSQNAYQSEFDLEFLKGILMIDDDDPIKVAQEIAKSTPQELISAILDGAITADAWPVESTFYEKAGPIDDTYADKLSLKTQFFLGEIATYCKTHNLLDKDMAEFLDKPEKAQALAQIVKDGLKDGLPIEPLIVKYLNDNQAEIGLTRKLNPGEEQELTQRFNQHWTIIKDSPHFDEFFVLDPSQKGNVYTHQGKMSCHFLEFYAHQTKKDLAELGRTIGMEGYPTLLEGEVESNRLNHKNGSIAEEHQKIAKFNEEVIEKVKTSPEELVEFLLEKSAGGSANFYKLENNGLNAIVHSRHFSEFARQISVSTTISEEDRSALVTILSAKNLEADNRADALWGNHASKSLTDVDISGIAAAMKQTVDNYHSKRSMSWWKGWSNSARTRQVSELEAVQKELSTLSLHEPPIQREKRVELAAKAVHVLDKIDNEISKEWNLFRSSLQDEVRAFKTQLKDMCNAEDLSFKPGSTIEGRLMAELAAVQDKEVRKILVDLPAHCHTKHAIELFSNLNKQEASTVANYLKLGFHPFTASVDKNTLLTKTIPKAFEKSNDQVLSMIKDSLPEEVVTALEDKTGSISPQVFTANNIRTWGVKLEEVANSKLSGMLTEVAEVDAMMKASNGKYTQPQIYRMVELARWIENAKREDYAEIGQLPTEVKETLNSFDSRLKAVDREPQDTRALTTSIKTALRGEIGDDTPPTDLRRTI